MEQAVDVGQLGRRLSRLDETVSMADTASEGVLVIPPEQMQSLRGFAPHPISAAVSASRLAHYNQLIARVIEVFGDEIVASRWLSSKSPDFGGITPLQAAERYGYEVQSLEPILVRLEHGIDF